MGRWGLGGGLGSNTPMKPTPDPTPADSERRLTELEIKASYSEDLLDTLNQIVAQQQQAIDHLRREVNLLRQQSADSGAPVFRSLADELPPHY